MYTNFTHSFILYVSDDLHDLAPLALFKKGE